MAHGREGRDRGSEQAFPKDCPKTLEAMCEALKEWGKEWEVWGEKARQEIRFLRSAICTLERKVYYNVPAGPVAGTVCDANGPIGGGPPQDPTGPPPKPPFK
jgi:hypothetical protein